MSSQMIRTGALVAVIFILGFSIGYAIDRYTNILPLPTLTLDENVASYTLLRPLLGVQFQKSLGETKFTSLLAKVHSVVASQPAGSLTRYAYYFKDMNGGLWTGINEDEQFDPASMLKVVFALAVYKQEEIEPDSASRQLTYTQKIANIQSSFTSPLPTNLTVGQSYSIPYLIKDMLSDSDNGAKDLLVTSTDPSLLNNIFTDLSVVTTASTNTQGFTISAKDYSRFLRILYYGTYNISWRDSNHLLELLAQSTYTDGLVAGVPSGIRVAHKYGEQIAMRGGVAHGIELSDCGIVYHPTHPYLICVMAEGKEVSQLSSFISKVSQATYQEVNAE